MLEIPIRADPSGSLNVQSACSSCADLHSAVCTPIHAHACVAHPGGDVSTWASRLRMHPRVVRARGRMTLPFGSNVGTPDRFFAYAQCSRTNSAAYVSMHTHYACATHPGVAVSTLASRLAATSRVMRSQHPKAHMRASCARSSGEVRALCTCSACSCRYGVCHAHPSMRLAPPDCRVNTEGWQEAEHGPRFV